LNNTQESPRGGNQTRDLRNETHINIRIDQKEFSVPVGVSVAAAIIASGRKVFYYTDYGEARGLLCGMGVCYDCLVTIDGKQDQRACLTLVEDGMQIITGANR
jgi:predicted molibdopterin-dependent oxidoreductase YjgC